MNLKVVVFFLFSLTFISCGGGKAITGSAIAKPDLPVKTAIASHNNANPEFTTLAARVQVVYEDEQRQQSITVSLRMEKDKTIWVKASLLGITLAKVLITQDRVSYYETISNTYFDGDFALLSNWLGTEIDFNKAQAILLGQSIFDINSEDYKIEVEQNKYKLQPKVQPQNFIHSLLLNPTNFKVHSETLSQPADKRILSVYYDDFQEIEGGFYPTDIRINASEMDSRTEIEINYRKIDLNIPISFPFTIPEGYEEIEI